ncbi:hypothetical protein K8I61_14370, partial [bacterium]|nr:hypothetical protein [bacterium]
LRRGLLRGQGEAIALTAAGRELGRRVVRGHRLWETYLAKHFPLPEDHLHEPAHRMEHFLDRDMRAQIEAEVEHPATDPHGRPMIPRGQPKED